MNDYLRLAICLVCAAIFEVAVAGGLEQLPERVDPPVIHKITIAVQEPPRVEPPPPPPEPEPPPPPKPEIKPQVVHEAPKPTPHAVQAEQPKDTPPPDQTPPPGPTSDEPVFGGINIDSTSQGGTGPVMPTGNGARPQGKQGSAEPPHGDKAVGEPVAAYQATKMPLPQGNCSGKYNDEALAAGIEGTVVLDLVVGEDGKVREVQVVQGIGHGLDQAALTALRTCKFSPGEKDGQAVAVKIKGFKIRFVLPEHD